MRARWEPPGEGGVHLLSPSPRGKTKKKKRKRCVVSSGSPDRPRMPPVQGVALIACSGTAAGSRSSVWAQRFPTRSLSKYPASFLAQPQQTPPDAHRSLTLACCIPAPLYRPTPVSWRLAGAGGATKPLPNRHTKPLSLSAEPAKTVLSISIPCRLRASTYLFRGPWKAISQYSSRRSGVGRLVPQDVSAPDLGTWARGDRRGRLPRPVSVLYLAVAVPSSGLRLDSHSHPPLQPNLPVHSALSPYRACHQSVHRRRGCYSVPFVPVGLSCLPGSL
ncbi:hypothetical protein QBC34DRAFT_121440 [Podospora aff. communis PSN243]|uniref:Uncharacterized protein n=1 Tax=Podospora aff. communis PSN243 TaxID=3040156 RepID=A0AAV9GKE4_9PEZI|nr:hypothetical protein QBC34DRAFT_121440 [Podospora aff. communis PSN243]